MVKYFAVDEAICTIYIQSLTLLSYLSLPGQTLSYPHSNCTKFILKFISAGGRYQLIEASNSSMIKKCQLIFKFSFLESIFGTPYETHPIKSNQNILSYSLQQYARNRSPKGSKQNPLHSFFTLQSITTTVVFSAYSHIRSHCLLR